MVGEYIPLSFLYFMDMEEEKRVVVKGTDETKRKRKIQPKDKEEPLSLTAQERLAEILTDSPHIVSLNGTEWEVRALRMGTQWLIAKKAIDVNKADSATMGDVLRQFAVNMPAVIDVITLALLNDRRKIFKDGNELDGYSDLYYTTRETLKWDCDPTKFGELLFEILQMMSVDFFWNALDILAVFRASVTERKRKRIAERN